jgi:hypothetical protein
MGRPDWWTNETERETDAASGYLAKAIDDAREDGIGMAPILVALTRLTGAAWLPAMFDAKLRGGTMDSLKKHAVAEGMEVRRMVASPTPPGTSKN